MRGPHSTGVIFVHQTGDDTIVKEVGTAYDLFGKRQFSDMLNKPARALIGHNRWATTGSVNRVNAHPFDFPNIVGSHNGTLRQQSLLPDWTKYEVDSENIFHSINEQGITKTAAKLNGAYALTWVNREDKTLNFLRNKERPLWTAGSVDGKTIFWASEMWMLLVACDKAGVAINTPAEIDTHKLYTLSLDWQGLATKPLPTATVKQMPQHVPPVVVSNTGVPGKYFGGKKKGAGGGSTTTNSMAYVGKPVTIYPDEIIKDGKGWYISCSGDDTGCSKDYRVYLKKKEDWDLMGFISDNEFYIFEGHVRSHVIKGGQEFFTIDPKSVEITECVVNDKGVYEYVLVEDADEEPYNCAWCAEDFASSIDEANVVCTDCYTQRHKD